MADENGNRYPIDFDAAQKGDVIPAARVSELVRVPPEHKLYSLRVCELVSTIKAGLWAIGKQFTVRSRDGSIEILNDEDASVYNQNWFNRHITGLRRNQEQLIAVDRQNLSEERKPVHDHALRMNGVMIVGMLNAKREIEPPVVQRDRPLPRGLE